MTVAFTNFDDTSTYLASQTIVSGSAQVAGFCLFAAGLLSIWDEVGHGQSFQNLHVCFHGAGMLAGMTRLTPGPANHIEELHHAITAEQSVAGEQSQQHRLA